MFLAAGAVAIKICNACKRGKCIESFFWQGRGISSMIVGACRACRRQRQKENRARNIEHYRANEIIRAARISMDSVRRENANRKRRERWRITMTPKRRIRARIGSQIYFALKTRSASKERKKTFDILGYSLNDLMAHIERQFHSGMSWDNMGEWHLDHITPLSSFKFTCIDDEFRAAWALTNLRPLWSLDNIKKGAKIFYLI